MGRGWGWQTHTHPSLPPASTHSRPSLAFPEQKTQQECPTFCQQRAQAAAARWIKGAFFFLSRSSFPPFIYLFPLLCAFSRTLGPKRQPSFSSTWVLPLLNLTSPKGFYTYLQGFHEYLLCSEVSAGKGLAASAPLLTQQEGGSAQENKYTFLMQLCFLPMTGHRKPAWNQPQLKHLFNKKP